MRRKNTTSYFGYILLMLAVDVLVINQILRFGTISESLSVMLYRYSLLLSCGIMVWFEFKACVHVINRFQLGSAVLFTYIAFIGLANNDSLAVILASEAGLLAFNFGLIIGNKKSDLYTELNHFHVFQWLIMAYFVIIEVINNFTRIIQARSDVIAANNMIYFGFPLLLYFRNKKVQPLEIGVTLFIVITAAFSFKRTTLIAVLISCAVYYISRMKSNTTKAKRMVLIPTFIVALLFAVKYVDIYTGGHISKRFNDISSTGGNHRTEIWHSTLEAVKNSNLINMLFGHGFNSVKDYLGLSAHNDFIEIVYDFGLAGILIYFLANCYVISCIIKAKKNNMSEYPVFISTYLAFLVLSVFSHVFLYAFVSIPMFIFIGYLCGKTKITEMNEENK